MRRREDAAARAVARRPWCRGRGVAPLLVALVLAPAAAARQDSPAARLAAALPDLFPSPTLVDAVEGGQQGARLVGTTDAQRELGLREGDVVVAVEGRALDADVWISEGIGTPATLTVLRRLPGERPVLPPEVIGRQVLGQFVELPEAERTPMRLARMLANQQTLVKDGVGVILVPAGAGRQDAEWLRVASPMPPASEAAIQQVRDALLERARLPRIEGTEAEAAARALRDGKHLEALERATRAMAIYVGEVANREKRDPLDALVAIHVVASAAVDQERRELMSPGARFGVVLEGSFHHIDELLPQNTLLAIESSNAFAFNVGLSVGLFLNTPTGGPPILRDLRFLVEYGLALNTFEGSQGDLTTGTPGEPRLKTTLHRQSFEFLYRPRVLSRLRPLLRGGPAVFTVRARVFDDDGFETEEVVKTDLGWIVGAGIDFIYLKDQGLRGTLVGTYRVLDYKFLPQNHRGWEEARNVLSDQVELENGIYKLDLDGWQLGAMLTYEF
ncbi:MAG: hypothetical protein ACE5G2_01685 [Candidatus Krumholzibacteriia bacterium]